MKGQNSFAVRPLGHKTLSASLVVMFILSIALIAVSEPAHAQSESSILIAPAFKGGGDPVFFDASIEITPGAGPIYLSGNDASAFPIDGGRLPIWVDDVLNVTITHLDGSIETLSHDFSNGCSGEINSSGPFNLTPFLHADRNTIRIRLEDKCGFQVGNSAIWLTGDFSRSGSGDEYVALGDSFASGEGNPRFPGGYCHRSEHAAAHLFASDPGIPSGSLPPLELTFQACSGATIGAFVKGETHEDDLTRLINQFEPLDAGTDVVTLSIGGNDVGFPDLIGSCVKRWPPGNRACSRAISKANRRLEELGKPDGRTGLNKLQLVYTAILDLAPNAQLYVVGYPRLLPLHPQAYCFRMSPREQRQINNLLKDGNELIETSVASRGPRAHYVDIAKPFLNHAVCDDDNWLRGINPIDIVYSFHPNRKGQRAIADSIRRAYNPSSMLALNRAPAS
jgi:lysophospholipase L1-like esterase